MKTEEVATIPCPRCSGTGQIFDTEVAGMVLAARRRGANLTLREVAAEMGISVGYLSDREKGRKQYADVEEFDRRHLTAILQLLKRAK